MKHLRNKVINQNHGMYIKIKAFLLVIIVLTYKEGKNHCKTIPLSLRSEYKNVLIIQQVNRK